MGRKKKILEQVQVDQIQVQENIQVDSLQFLKDYLINQQKQDEDFNSLQIIFNDKKIEIFQYLSIESKLLFIESVAKVNFQENDNDIIQFNPALKELMFVYNILKYYTNLELTDNFTEVYDLFMKSGLYIEIIKNIPFDEINFLENMIDQSIQEEFNIIEKQEEKEQSFAFVANKLITQITEFISDLNPEKIDEMVKSMSNLQNADLIRGMMDGKIQ